MDSPVESVDHWRRHPLPGSEPPISIVPPTMSLWSMDRCLPRWPVLLAGLGLALVPGTADAGKAILKNGSDFGGALTALRGLKGELGSLKAGKFDLHPVLLIDAGYRRTYVTWNQVAEFDEAQSLLPFDVFELPQRKTGYGGVDSVGLPLRITDFDGHGHRTVTLRTPRGELNVVQGVTKIAPQFVTVEGITHDWWQGLPTAAVPADQLAAMLRTAADPRNPDDRMSVARFYLQAGLHEAAAAELAAIARDFPEMKAKADELDGELRQLRANRLLAELRKRQAAGQHRLALAAAEAFPTGDGFDAAVLRQVDALRAEYAAAREKAERAVMLLGELEGMIEKPEARSAVAGLRSVLREQLDWDTVSRLDAFLTLADDPKLDPSGKLALAYSGWILGSGKAVTDLDQTLTLWRARDLVGEYLRSDDPQARRATLDELRGLEGVGAAAVADLIPLLPPWAETPGLTPGEAATLETAETVPGWGEAADAGGKAPAGPVAGPVRYSVVLPPEYSPVRAYPLVVTLRPAEWSVEQAAGFWGVARDGNGSPTTGPAGREGYVVIAPEYAAAKQGEYGYTVKEHQAVLAAIRDAKSRFVIDSDRVFVVGHGMGGDAAFDLAMSHPDLFAGAVPISGLSRHFTKHYWRNADRTPFLVLNGEKDRAARDENAGELNEMMKRGYDVTFVEFVGRGYEYYFEELPGVFDWMSRLRRPADPTEVDARTLRPCDTRFYWLESEGLPRSVVLSDVINPGGRGVSPMKLGGKITPGNSIVLTSAASKNVLRLNAGLIDLTERVRVKVGSRQVFNGFVEPDIAVLLDDFRRNGDRQRLYPVRIVVE